MITDYDIAMLCAAAYSPAYVWDWWEDGPAHDDVAWGIKRVDDVTIIVFRGSTQFIDWRRDLDTWAEPKVSHPQLGPIHDGFFAGMEDAWARVQGHIKPGEPTMFAGHSLGAARANIMTGLAVVDGIAPARKVLFGSPKSGFQQLADITSKVPGASYRNGNSVAHDPVTDVPYYVPPLLAYVHDRPLQTVCYPPTPGAELGIFAWHHIGLYVKALKGQTT